MELFPISRVMSCNTKDLSHLEFRVLCRLAHHSNNDTLETYVTQDTISKYTGAKQQSIARAVKGLIDKGYVIYLPNPDRKNNKYKLTMKGEQNEQTGSKNVKRNTSTASKDATANSNKRNSLPLRKYDINKEGTAHLGW